MKHKNTVSNNWATKLQSRVGKQQYQSLEIMTNNVCSNQQVGKQNPRNICKYTNRKKKHDNWLVVKRYVLAITWAGHYQSDDRKNETNGMLAITSQEFPICSNTVGG